MRAPILTPSKPASVVTGTGGDACASAVGYRSRQYATAFGQPVPLARSGGHAVLAHTPAGGVDASAPYPLLVLDCWGRLAADLDDLDDLVALAGHRDPDVGACHAGSPLAFVAVTDPFAQVEPSTLTAAFPDHLRAWKPHHVADLRVPRMDLVDRRHQRNVLRARVDVEACTLADHLPDWGRLYGHLIERHAITGPQRFSPAAFRAMADTPGLHAWRAVVRQRTVGMVLVVVDGDHAWYHLGAFDDVGYERGASFALFWQILEDLAVAGVRWLDFGAGAGATKAATSNAATSNAATSSAANTTAAADSGLDRFKRGWCNSTRPTWLGGRILDHDGYAAEARAAGAAGVDWFPSYRAGQYS